MSRITAHPYVPLRWEEVPAGAAPALQEACSAWRLDQLFVIPGGARFVGGPRALCVETPTQVVGLADRGVALWADTKPAPGAPIAIGLDELAAIDRRQILLFTRLTFLAHKRRLAVHFDALAGHELDPALAAVRAAASGYPLAVPDEPAPSMPSAWAHVAYSLAVRLRPRDPALLRFSELEGAHSVGGTLLALTPGELVIVREPDQDNLGDAPVCGHDLLHVMRRSVEGAEHTETGICIHAGGVDLDVPLARSVADDLLALIERAADVGQATDHHQTLVTTNDAAH
jgi:hypothetical protein